MRRALIAAAGVVLGLGLSGPGGAAAGEAERETLERYRPILRYDVAEEYFAQPVSRRAERIDRDLIYGRVAETGGERWLQYWLFYAQNTQDRGLFRTGRHEGDWEFVQFHLGAGGAPETATFAQHSEAERCAYETLELRSLDGAQVPVVYVANGSHASYPRSGTADRPWPDPNDEATGSGREVRPEVMPIGESNPAWVADPRPWGSSSAGIVPGEQSSPPGPRFQSDGRWDDPAAYDDAARTCGSPPASRPWQTPALVGVAVVLVLGGAALRRRRLG